MPSKKTVTEHADDLRAAVAAAQKRQEARTGTTTPPRARHARPGLEQADQ